VVVVDLGESRLLTAPERDCSGEHLAGLEHITGGLVLARPLPPADEQRDAVAHGEDGRDRGVEWRGSRLPN